MIITALELLAPAAAEPLVITLAEAKAHLKVEVGDDDSLITAYMQMARDWIEEYTGRQLITTTWALLLPKFPCGRDPIEITKMPAATITSLAYAAPGDSEASNLITNYLFVPRADLPGLIYPAIGEYWPATRCDMPNAVGVAFTAGYGSTGASIPAIYKHAIKLLLTDAYERREPEALGWKPEEVPAAVERLLFRKRSMEYV